MQQTSNYQLSQWAPGDRILRENFNSDNAKVDAAIKAVQDAATTAIAAVRAENRVEKLLDVTTTAAANQVNLDVSQVDFTRYREVTLYVDIHPSSNSYAMNMRCNNRTGGYLRDREKPNWLVQFCAGSDLNRGCPAVVLHLFFPTGCIVGYSIYGYFESADAFFSNTSSLAGVLTGLTAAGLNSLQFVTSDAAKVFGAGCNFTIYGVKK